MATGILVLCYELTPKLAGPAPSTRDYASLIVIIMIAVGQSGLVRHWSTHCSPSARTRALLFFSSSAAESFSFVCFVILSLSALALADLFLSKTTTTTTTTTTTMNGRR